MKCCVPHRQQISSKKKYQYYNTIAMTQKEFEERTELKLTAVNYTEGLKLCYMNTDLDKDAFWKLWMKNPGSSERNRAKTVLVRELYEERKCLWQTFL